MKVMKTITKFILSILIVGAALPVAESSADNLCVNKKTRVIASRPGACKKNEVLASSLTVESGSTSGSASDVNASSINMSDTGGVSGGSDTNTGLDISVTRSGATGGNINSTGLNVSVVGDSGGDSTAVGLLVSASGADTNYCAIFQSGNVGIGVSDPDEQLEMTGRIHLGQTSSPSTTANKLYNLGGTLYWGGQAVSTGGAGSGTITGVSAGTGLTGGGTSGAVSLSVDVGTSASKIVQLNGSGALPAVSGANLSTLNATSISSGTLDDNRLSSNVSKLGSLIGLTSEVSGVLPVANGGTGANALTNLLTLGTHTTGSYVASIASGTGISGGAAGTEGSALTLSIDQSFAPTWSAVHSFTSKINVGTATASDEALHVNGRIEIDPAIAPVTTTNKLYNVAGDLYFNGQNITDTALGGDITGVTAGSGLTGGASSGDATLVVDSGTTADKILKLDNSARIPAVSGELLTTLNGSNISSGTVADARLSSAVTKLGPDIDLASAEVTGTLPIANGGIGATSLTNLIALTTHTTGNYVAATAAGAGISIGSTGVEGGTSTISVDQTFTPTWTGMHTFSGTATDITTVSNQNFAIIPHGIGQVGIGTSATSAMLDTVLASTSSTAAAEKGAEINITDTGNVASGTDETYGLDVNVTRTGASGGTIDSTGLNVSVTADTNANSTATGLNVSVTGADTNYAALFDGGSVGINTGTPIAALDTRFASAATSAGTERGGKIQVDDTGIVTSGTDATYGLEIDVDRTGATGGTLDTTGLDINVTGDVGGAGTASLYGLSVNVSGGDAKMAAKFTGGSVSLGGGPSAISSNISAGSLLVDDGIICVDDTGNNCDDVARTDGTVVSVNAAVTGIDLAENFPIEDGDIVEAGDIVMINTKKASRCIETIDIEDGSKTCTKEEEGFVPFVTKSDNNPRNIKRVIGVISTKPGVILGGFADHTLINYQKVPVALAGRIPLKVTLENGSIEVGDRITISSTLGMGKKALSGDHIVGIALEPFENSDADENGTGKVLTLVK